MGSGLNTVRFARQVSDLSGNCRASRLQAAGLTTARVNPRIRLKRTVLGQVSCFPGKRET